MQRNSARLGYTITQAYLISHIIILEAIGAIVFFITKVELGMVAVFVYIPLVCIFSALVLFIWAMYQKKKGKA